MEQEVFLKETTGKPNSVFRATQTSGVPITALRAQQKPIYFITFTLRSPNSNCHPQLSRTVNMVGSTTAVHPKPHVGKKKGGKQSPEGRLLCKHSIYFKQERRLRTHAALPPTSHLAPDGPSTAPDFPLLLGKTRRWR